ncbi:hypothetical protein M9H77_37027 [Catharanthus roseus]|uniref:Uncharacterized protein n=1 Tax=Catharanthus roseus TaxID=4058 RepID=A0ACB9ZTF7_CATRO|nr:hypothetical protein M9H77_37027 [Catharanthus roseus]
MKPHWVHKLKIYYLIVARRHFIDSDILRFQKAIWLGDAEVAPLRDWFYDHLIREAKYLDLNGSTLDIEHSTSLEEICKGSPPTGSFKRLEKIRLVIESLNWLEELEVISCPVLKEIFKKEEGEMEITINEVKWPKLYQLRLINLRSLQDFCKGIARIEKIYKRNW